MAVISPAKAMEPSHVLPIPFPDQGLFNPVTNVVLILCFSFPDNKLMKACFFVLAGWWVLSSYFNASGDWMTDYFDAQNAAMVFCRGVGMLGVMDAGRFEKRGEGEGVERWEGKGRGDGVGVGGERGKENGTGTGTGLKMDGSADREGKEGEYRIIEGLRRGSSIWIAYRGYGWSFQVNGIPPAKAKGYPRSKFIVENMFSILARLFLVDISLAWVRGYTVFGQRPVQASLYEQSFMWRILYAGIIGLSLRNLFQVFCLTLATLTVATGLYEPADWPPMFGSLWEAYSVRRFWSYVWHQLMRLNFEGIARYITYRILCIKRESRMGRETKGLFVFVLSGLCHAFGSVSTDGASYGEVRFFGSQFLAIILEETVFVKLAYKPGTKQEKLVLRLIGYVWTAFWVLVGLVGWLDRMRSVGAPMEDQVNLGVGTFLLDRIFKT